MIGTRIREFEVRERIGSGGMGVVYSAWDEALERFVALKALPDSARQDPVLWQRLRREAQTAATLTHPAICQIHQFLPDENPPSIILELVKGPTLGARIAEGAMDIPVAVQTARRIAEGLAEAHAANVIHRDIKPSNILLTPDGRPKLTDFGLAVLPEATRLTIVPSPMGTVPYMSPEQASGDDPTPQMDVWSLGVVLYEMLTGRRPFRGEIADVILYDIRHTDPVPVRELRPEIPGALARIVARAMSRDLRTRYPDAGAMAKELLAVEQALITATSPTGLPEPEPPRPDPRRLMLIAVAVLILSVLTGWGVVRLLQRPQLPEFSARRITDSDGWEGEPALSPDGTRVAYAANEFGNLDIFVSPAEGGRPFRVTRDDGDDSSPTWFPAGDRLLFYSDRAGGTGIWSVSPFGGDAQLVVEGAAEPAISPDGQWLACVVRSHNGSSRIAVAPMDHPEELREITHDEDGVMNHRSPSWAPDSRRICYSAYDGLWVIDRTGLDSRRIEDSLDAHTWPAWSPDGRYVYFSGMVGPMQGICRVPAGGGRIVHVTMGTGPERNPTMSADGRRMAYSTERVDSDLVLRDLESGHEYRLGGISDDFHPTLNHDGSQMAFVSRRWGGRADLWIQEFEAGRPSGEPRLLLDAPLRCAMPEFSPDGRRLVYYVIDVDQRHLEMVGVKGGRAVRLTEGPWNDYQPHWSPQGDKVVFTSDRSGATRLWVLPVHAEGAAGEPWRVDAGDHDAFMPRWSPSGLRIAYIAREQQTQDVWVWSAEVGARQLTRDVGISRIRWGADDGTLWAVTSEGSAGLHLRRLDLETGDWTTVAPSPFPDPNIGDPSFDLSRDMRFLVYPLVANSGDLWLLSVEDGAF